MRNSDATRESCYSLMYPPQPCFVSPRERWTETRRRTGLKGMAIASVTYSKNLRRYLTLAKPLHQPPNSATGVEDGSEKQLGTLMQKARSAPVSTVSENCSLSFLCFSFFFFFLFFGFLVFWFFGFLVFWFFGFLVVHFVFQKSGEQGSK